eukprot:3876520-Rhodomonas_salina.1
MSCTDLGYAATRLWLSSGRRRTGQRLQRQEEEGGEEGREGKGWRGRGRRAARRRRWCRSFSS